MVTLLNTGCVAKFSNVLEFSPTEELSYTPIPYAGQGRLVIVEGQAFPSNGRPPEEVATLTSDPGVRISLIQSSDGTIIYKGHQIGSFYEKLSGANYAAIPSGMIVQLPAGTYKLGARYRKKNSLGMMEYSTQDRYVTEDLQKGRHYMLKALLIKSVKSKYSSASWNLKFEEAVFRFLLTSGTRESNGDTEPADSLEKIGIEDKAIYAFAQFYGLERGREYERVIKVYNHKNKFLKAGTWKFRPTKNIYWTTYKYSINSKTDLLGKLTFKLFLDNQELSEKTVLVVEGAVLENGQN